MKYYFILMFFLTTLSAEMKIYVSNNSTITTISKQEIRNLYLKKTKLLNGVKVIILDNEKFYDEFNKVFLNKTPSQIHAYWMRQIFLGKNF